MATFFFLQADKDLLSELWLVETEPEMSQIFFSLHMT
jgi:hypothetical protein